MTQRWVETVTVTEKKHKYNSEISMSEKRVQKLHSDTDDVSVSRSG